MCDQDYFDIRSLDIKIEHYPSTAVLNKYRGVLSEL